MSQHADEKNTIDQLKTAQKNILQFLENKYIICNMRDKKYKKLSTAEDDRYFDDFDLQKLIYLNTPISIILEDFLNYFHFYGHTNKRKLKHLEHRLFTQVCYLLLEKSLIDFYQKIYPTKAINILKQKFINAFLFRCCTYIHIKLKIKYENESKSTVIQPSDSLIKSFATLKQKTILTQRELTRLDFINSKIKIVIAVALKYENSNDSLKMKKRNFLLNLKQQLIKLQEDPLPEKNVMTEIEKVIKILLINSSYSADVFAGFFKSDTKNAIISIIGKAGLERCLNSKDSPPPEMNHGFCR